MAIRFQANLPIKFWVCAQSVVYLINRVLSPALSGKSPFAMFFGREPSLQHLRVVGCLCYVVSHNTNGDKFGARFIKSVFLGYSSTQKGYKLYNLSTQSIFISKNVIFKENEYPFQLGLEFQHL